jgi:hypothetical protein
VVIHFHFYHHLISKVCQNIPMTKHFPHSIIVYRLRGTHKNYIAKKNYFSMHLHSIESQFKWWWWWWWCFVEEKKNIHTELCRLNFIKPHMRTTTERVSSMSCWWCSGKWHFWCKIGKCINHKSKRGESEWRGLLKHVSLFCD